MNRLTSTVLIVVMILCSSVAYADHGRGHGGHHRGGYYAGGLATGLGLGMLAGAIYASQPRYYGPVYYNGMPYWTCNGGYYMVDPYGNFYPVMAPQIYPPAQPQVIIIKEDK